MGKTEMIREILFLQSEVDHIVKRFTAEPWIELKMTIAQLKSLFFIAEKGKTNFKKLADALGVTPPNITGIVDRLVEQGLVSRTENIEDRRVMLLQMTDKGLTLVNNLHENRFNNLNNLMINMSEDDLYSLMKGMKGILKANDDLGLKISA
jgi:MarR family transcriptional regulator, organic hydroperoxide resistance regulator